MKPRVRIEYVLEEDEKTKAFSLVTSIELCSFTRAEAEELRDDLSAAIEDYNNWEVS